MQTDSKSGNQFLFNGLETITNTDQFNAATKQVTEAAFTKFFKDQEQGKLKWYRIEPDWNDLVTEVTVKNGRGEEITVAAILYTYYSDEGYKTANLVLGSKNSALSLNINDDRVKRLYEQLTGKPWSY